MASLDSGVRHCVSSAVGDCLQSHQDGRRNPLNFLAEANDKERESMFAAFAGKGGCHEEMPSRVAVVCGAGTLERLPDLGGRGRADAAVPRLPQAPAAIPPPLARLPVFT